MDADGKLCPKDKAEIIAWLTSKVILKEFK
jgi:hypothetical protein